MTIATRLFDPVELLAGDHEAQQAFLDEALDSGDPNDIKRALATLVRARNASALADEVGVSREGLRKALSAAGNPTLSTLVSLSNALDLKLFRSSRTAGRAAGGTAVKRKPTRAKSGAKAAY